MTDPDDDPLPDVAGGVGGPRASTPSTTPSLATCSSARRPPAPSRTWRVAVASLFGVEDPEIRVIGTRHGEKLYESLLSREELQKADDQGDYYRVPLDARPSSTSCSSTRARREVVDHDYTSHNTERLDVEGVKRLLLQLPADPTRAGRGRPDCRRSSP